MGNKKSYSCEKLGKTLNFLPNKVNFCCSYAEGPSLEYLPREQINIKKIIKAEKKYIKKLKYGTIPKQCEGCIDYKEKHYKNFMDFLFSGQKSFLIDEIVVNHYKQCDCRCIYCAQKEIWGEEISQNYDLLPVIKDLYENKAIDNKNLRVEFQGGNVSVLKEFDLLMQTFLEHECKRFTVFTNGIKYLPVIEEASNQKANIDLQISLDCGTAEAFRKIKQVDAFDNVIDNIKKFSIKTTAIINLKYILIKGWNDNKWEVDRFLEVVRDLRCISNVCFDIDYRDILLNESKDFKVPSHYYDIINLAKRFCSENRINFIVTKFASDYMKKNREIKNL